MTFDVFFYEAYEEEAPALQHFVQPGIRAGYSPRTIQEEAHVDPPAALISIRTQSTVPATWYPALRGVLARTTGRDHLLALREAAGAQLALATLNEYCSRSVAEQAALMWLSLLRRLPKQLAQFESFNRDGLTGGECAGRTLLVVGVGRIGIELIRIGRGLGMRVLGVDIIRRHAEVTYVSIEEGLRQADVIVCAMDLNDENLGFFNFERLRAAKRGALFVNVSRGECSPAPDLVRALDEQVLGGVAMDVYNDEPILAVHLRSGGASASDEFKAVRTLMGRDNVVLTPHNAFNTAEALTRKAEQTARQVEHFLVHGKFLNPFPE